MGHRRPLLPVIAADAEAAMDWMDANQLGRRNLSPDQLSWLRGRRYSRTKKAQGGTGANQHEQRCQIVPSAKTAESLAKEHGVNESTIRRARQCPICTLPPLPHQEGSRRHMRSAVDVSLAVLLNVTKPKFPAIN